MNVWRRAVRILFDTRRHSEEDYELLSSEPNSRLGLPTLNGHSHRRSVCGIFYPLLHCFTLRRTFIFLALIPFFLVLLVLLRGVPPSYEDIRTYERHLPQHNLTAAKEGMYLRFPDHLWGHGLNNILQEALLMSYLAYMSRRSFVFEDYVWSHTPFPYTIYDFALRPARIPLNAFISGPTAGGPMPGRRAVNAEFWEVVCPKEKRRVISSKDAPNWDEGSVLVNWWVEKLKDIDDPCVEVDSSSQPVFDVFLFGGPRILSLWTGLSSSPILTDYTWSPLVQSTVSRNFAILQPESARSLYDLSSKSTLSGLVAVHLRRGDYKRHCPRLAVWQSLYMGLNQFSDLPDKFDPSRYANTSHSQMEEYYLLHCLPTTEQIVARLHELRLDHPTLRRVYVLTNGWGWWIDGLKNALQKDGWDDLKSSLDMKLDSEQTYVAMAADMAIAEKAEVFLGNGFSSLSANIVMLRMAKGLDVSSNRFL